jgi:osmotically-inducible protein OsmY
LPSQVIAMSHDSELQQSVLSELGWEPSVTAAHIGVTANGGVVTLTGQVDSFTEKHAAEAAARRVKGVKAVAEEIEVRLPFDAQRSDAQIAAAAVERLAWNVSVPKDSVQVSVEKGRVTLTGEVGWWYQKEAAERDVRPLHGVIGVWNRMTLKPRVDTANLGEDITLALNRSTFFDPQTTQVHADGGRVVLSGTVHSLHERDVAGQTAWAAPGVISVENDLVVV